MDKIEYVGFLASALATFSFLPQVAKTWRTWRAEDFSLITLLMLEVGTGLWIAYGLWRAAPAIWIGNSITFTLVALILIVKIQNFRTGPLERQSFETRP